MSSLLQTVLAGSDNVLLHFDKIPRIEISMMLPLIALGVATAIFGYRRLGMGMAYCGSQVGFSLYMKVVLADIEISTTSAGTLRGIPAAFLITAIQQIAALFVLGAISCLLALSRWPYRPKRITTYRETMVILLFSFAFAVNIGLNNFSLAFVSVSTNMMIRSCLPLATLACQMLLLGRSIRKENTVLEVGLMLIGILFAGIATFCQEGSAFVSTGKNHAGFGLIICIVSVGACALNLVLAELLGEMRLNPLDSMLYMALPVAVIMIPPTLLWSHPVNWPGYNSLTDVQIFHAVFHLKPSACGLILLSGIFAAGYNLLTYTLVQTVSPSFTAFAGNFNKTIIIALSFVSRLEELPRGLWGVVFIIAVTGNIVAFAWYSTLVEPQSQNWKEKQETKALTLDFNKKPRSREFPGTEFSYGGFRSA